MGKKQPQQEAAEDDRFAKVYTDPRFMTVPKKLKKVQIDKRFGGMFTDKTFNVVSNVDKYGRKITKKDDHALKHYYQASGSEKEDQEAKSGSSAEESGSEE